MFRAFLNKIGKHLHRERIANHKEFDRPDARKHTKVSAKMRRKYVKMNPISDAFFCDDVSYVPFRYIRGTISIPGSAPGKGYVQQ